MTRRLPALSMLAAFVAAASSLLVPAATPAVAASHGVTAQRDSADRRDPANGTKPSQAFVDACHNVGTGVSAQNHCAKVAAGSFNRARAAEGMPPMILPSDWATLPPATQLLTVTNIERVDRGLRPATGISAALNRYARQGADADTDPPFPATPHGTAETSNWAGVGNSVLLADFIWMYDDGAGSVNVDCGSGGTGCWGHRHNILGEYDAPLKIGAVSTPDPRYGASIAVEWIGGDREDRAVTRWSPLQSMFRVGVSATTVHVARDPRLTLWASGTSMQLRLTVTTGARHWSVSVRHCTLAAGTTRTVTVSHHGPSGGRGTLVVSGAGATRHIPLRG